MSNITAPVRRAPRELWLIAQAFLMTLCNLFGAPEDVARRHTLAAKAHKLLASWLRAGEALLRKLLLIEAAALTLPPARPRQVRVRTRVARGFDADAPEQWRVSFSCMDRRRPRRPASAHAGGTPAVHTRYRSAWPLAERYEALLRAFNDPSGVAKRLAPAARAPASRRAPARRTARIREPRWRDRNTARRRANRAHAIRQQLNRLDFPAHFISRSFSTASQPATGGLALPCRIILV